MRVKCKNCKKFIRGICDKFKRRRSSGKKRECAFHDPKPPKQRVYAPYFRFISREERRKMRLKAAEDRKKAEAYQKEMEQKKLLAASMQDIKAPQAKVVIKKPNIFKRMFRRTGGK
jgi:hypothetical protein